MTIPQVPTFKNGDSCPQHGIEMFTAIEGLRGWLAWTVVLSHLTYFGNVNTRPGLFYQLAGSGSPAVLVFIMVSGFVITHIIVEQREPYSSYIVKRFMRLFPLFAVTSAAGYFTTGMIAEVMRANAFNDQGFADLTMAVADSQLAHLPSHVLAHVTMLHGLMPSPLLPFSEYVFNIPAWSISLEWQFYLVAPMVIAVLRGRARRVVAFALAVAVIEIIAKQLHHADSQPSALPMAANYFAVGIVSRMLWPDIRERGWFLYALAGAAIVFPMQNALRPLVIFMVTIFGLSKKRHDTALGAVYDAALTSDLARYFGSRSYSIYLTHYVLLSAISWLHFRLTGLAPSLTTLTLIGLPSVVLVSECTYRWIEVPGIALGRRMARWRGSESPAPIVASAGA